MNSSGELTKGQIIGVHYAINDDNEIIIEPILAENGNEHILQNGIFYESVNDYKNGKERKFYTQRISSTLRYSFGFDNNIKQENTAPYKTHYWTMKNGKPTKVEFIIKDIVCRYGGDLLINGEQLPIDIYESESDCISWNDIVVNEDGKKSVIKSRKRTTMPTKEQIKLVENLMDALKKATDSGLVIAMDDNADIIAINMNNISEWHCDCCDGEEGEDALWRTEKGVNHFTAPSNFFYLGDSAIIVEKYKES